MAATSREVERWDVVCAVTIFKLDCFCSGSECEKLVSKTDTHYRAGVRLHEFAEVVYGRGAVSWISGAIGATYVSGSWRGGEEEHT